MRFVPTEIVPQHIRRKEKGQFLAITHLYIRMTLQHLMKPG
jgi:hypothetical protein